MVPIKLFIETVVSQKGSGYVYGAQGEVLTPSILTSFVKIHGRKRYYFLTYSAEKWFGKVSYDCSGLIIWALQKLGLMLKTEDYNADGIYKKFCLPITKDELKPGDLCFNNKNGGIVHVGMYVGNNRVVHARGTNYGVVETDLFSSFNTFGRLIYFADELSKPWEQRLGEDAIDELAFNGFVNDPRFWKGQDLKNGTVPLWTFFEMQRRLLLHIEMRIHELKNKNL
jgi:cell wall-associated NlpC family hydrolase